MKYRLFWQGKYADCMVIEADSADELIVKRETHVGLAEIADRELWVTPERQRRRRYDLWVMENDAAIRSGEPAATRSLQSGADQPT